VDRGETQLAYSNLYNLQSHTGEPTYALFGGWQTEKTLGYVAAVQNQGHTETYISTEDRGDRNIQTELVDRIGQVIERSQTQQATPTDRTNTPEPDHQAEQPHELQPGEPTIDQATDTGRDPYIDQAIQEAQDRQQEMERGIEQDRDNDRGFGIE
jgi:hypothetical protein